MSDTYKYCIKCDGIMGYPDPVEVLSGEHRCRNGHDNGIDDEDRAQVLIDMYDDIKMLKAKVSKLSRIDSLLS